MNAKEAYLNKFMAITNTQFIVPVYQRHYVWTKKECKKLLNDILEVGNDNKKISHFIGSIVYVTDPVPTADIQEFVVVDGQQRLTTIMLIYLTMYKLAEKMGRDDLKAEIYETYLTNKWAKDEKRRIKLKPTENNEEALNHIFTSNDYKGISNIVDNFNFFKTEITENNYQIVKSGLQKLIFIEMVLDKNIDDPQRIFESMNSTGLDLSEADLIRNYILMNLSIEDQNKVYANYWEQIENFCREDETNTNKVSDFIRDFLTMKIRQIPNKNRVYETFKNNYTMKTLEDIENKLSEIKEYSSYYNKLINPKEENDKDISRELAHIKKMEINVSYPFLIRVYKDYADETIDKQILIDVLKLIQSFAWRRFIADIPTQSLNKIFMSLYTNSKIDTNKYIYSIQAYLITLTGFQKFPANDEVIRKLKEKNIYDIRSKSKSYLFQKLENYNSKEIIDFENSELTIEHIFPQKPDIKWKKLLSEEDYKEMKDKYLHTISNLTLLDENGTLGNKTFKEKKEMNKDGKEQGYMYSKLWLNSFLKDIDEWNVENLDKRFEKIKNRFLKIWEYPNIELPDKEVTTEVNIFEAEDPTNKKLDYAIFFDKEIKVNQISLLYSEVMSVLFDEYKDTFLSNEMTELLKLTKDSNSLIIALEIGDNYFIESNLSNQDKFTRIKRILTILDLDDELFIKYKEN